MPARITIVIATYNCAEYLQKCFDSIASQTLSEIEVLVSDGGSTDRTVDVIKSNSSLVTDWISGPDQGIYDAWNKVLHKVTGDWVYFIGADDVLHTTDCLERVSKKLEDLPKDILVAYGQVRFVRLDGSFRTLGRPWQECKSLMSVKMVLPHQGVFHSKMLFDQYGSFDNEFQIAGDYKLIMQSLKFADPVFLGEITVADQLAGGKSGLRKNRTETLMEFRKVQKVLGLPLHPAWLLEYSKSLVWKVLSRFINVGTGA